MLVCRYLFHTSHLVCIRDLAHLDTVQDGLHIHIGPFGHLSVHNLFHLEIPTASSLDQPSDGSILCLHSCNGCVGKPLEPAGFAPT